MNKVINSGSVFYFQAEDGILDAQESRGLGDVYKRQAMNREMWANPATQRNVAQLKADGITVLDVGEGDQACGEVGDGRMLEADEILSDLIAFFTPKSLVGHNVLITAGPTYELSLIHI